MHMNMITDWDDAYANRDHALGAQAMVDRWAPDAAAFRAELDTRKSLRENIAYGEGPRQRYDLMLPQGTPKGLVVYVHGGYWRLFDKSTWSHFGRGPVARGWAVAMPSYTVCPQGSMPGIAQEIVTAIEAAAREVAGPIRLTGHSAGGHLVARMACRDMPLAPATRGRIEKTVAISGVPDLRPLLRTQMNADLKLDLALAEQESPALHTPVDGTDIICWAGGDERPEFLRQNRLLPMLWFGCGVKVREVVDVQKHHFNVIDGLCQPDSPLCSALLD